jgi:hypothetical protein
LAPQGKRLGDVPTPTDPAVEENLDLIAHCVDDRRQGAQRAGDAVEVVTTVVGHRDSVGPDVYGATRVVRAEDTLDDERPAPDLA